MDGGFVPGLPGVAGTLPGRAASVEEDFAREMAGLPTAKASSANRRGRGLCGSACRRRGNRWPVAPQRAGPCRRGSGAARRSGPVAARRPAVGNAGLRACEPGTARYGGGASARRRSPVAGTDRDRVRPGETCASCRSATTGAGSAPRPRRKSAFGRARAVPAACWDSGKRPEIPFVRPGSVMTSTKGGSGVADLDPAPRTTADTPLNVPGLVFGLVGGKRRLRTRSHSEPRMAAPAAEERGPGPSSTARPESFPGTTGTGTARNRWMSPSRNVWRK